MKGKMINCINKRTTGWIILVAMTCTALLSACNGEFPNLLREFPSDNPPEAGRAKVLYIVVDGLRGKAVQDLDPPRLKQLRRHALYTYGSLADTATTTMVNATGWANLLTGVEPAKHGTTDDDFSGLDIAAFRLFLPDCSKATNRIPRQYTPLQTSY